jgi:hypothetical protein
MVEFYKILQEEGFEVFIFSYPPSEEPLKKSGLNYSPILCFNDYVAISSPPTFLFTGTSECGDDDKKYWEWAKGLGIKTIAWLDQAVRMEERFPINEPSSLPDVLLSTNENVLNHPKVINLKCNKDSKGSPYLAKLQKEIKRSQSPQNIAIFASEPTPESYKLEHGIDDASSLIYALKTLSLLKENWTLIIKPHPRDSQERLESILSTISTGKNIQVTILNIEKLDAFRKAKLVFGMRSMFLVEASSLGIPTVSFQPGRKTDYSLIDKNEGIFVSETIVEPQKLNSLLSNTHLKKIQQFNRKGFLELLN